MPSYIPLKLVIPPLNDFYTVATPLYIYTYYASFQIQTPILTGSEETISFYLFFVNIIIPIMLLYQYILVSSPVIHNVSTAPVQSHIIFSHSFCNISTLPKQRKRKSMGRNLQPIYTALNVTCNSILKGGFSSSD